MRPARRTAGSIPASQSSAVSSVPSRALASNTFEELRLAAVACKGDALVARFTDGSGVAVEVKRYPRLWNATPAQRKKWRLIGRGLGVHWPELGEDLSVENLLFASARVRA